MALAALQPHVVLRIEGKQRAAQFALLAPQGARVLDVAVRCVAWVGGLYVLVGMWFCNEGWLM